MTSTAMPVECLRKLQRFWDNSVVEMTFRNLKEQLDGDVFVFARLLASSTTEAGAWLQIVPLKSLKTLLTNEELRISASLRLGTAVCVEHFCRCGQVADSREYHGLSFGTGGSMSYRHDTICDFICTVANTAGLRARREPRGLCMEDAKRSDVVTALPISQGKPWAADITCVNTVFPIYLPKTTVKAGTGATERATVRELQKRATYEELQEDFVFSGIGVETFGSYGPEAGKMVSLLGKMIKEKTDEPRSRQFLRQRISVCLQKGDAKYVLGTYKEARGLEEIFYTVF